MKNSKIKSILDKRFPSQVVSNMPELYASSGEIVTCTSGHKVATIAHNLWSLHAPSIKDFVWENGMEPIAGSYKETCFCKCGARYLYKNICGMPVLHFADGWRTKHSMDLNDPEVVDDKISSYTYSYDNKY